MVRKLFGTDGIRGVANKHPMTAETALKVGKAVARHFKNGGHPQIVVGKDTRLSGYLFENALTAGLVAAGATVFLVGPLPTPAIAHITKSFAADAGIMISASHNPAAHNGIKLFSGDGFKLPDEDEERIEQLMAEEDGKDGGELGKAKRIDDARGRYIEFAKATIDNASLKGLKIVLDSANGAAYSVAPVILTELGAEVFTYNNMPDGLNINEECGATHPEVISNLVQAHQADIGIALDGDADRVIMVDEKGREVDGDHIIALLALDMQQRKELKGGVVVTEYSNKGFDEAMTKAGIDVVRCQNGDRYVIEELRKREWNIGGEQSGHIILFDHNTTGDGTITALHVLRIMQERKKRLSELAHCMTTWPQVLKSIPVKEKRPIEELEKVSAAIKDAETALGAAGRVFVRYSGTEKVARIMVEGKDAKLTAAHATRIAKAFKDEVGA